MNDINTREGCGIDALLFHVKAPMKKDKTTQKKEHVEKHIDKLDPNNNINKQEKPDVTRNGKTVKDDGFEHRKSEETL